MSKSDSFENSLLLLVFNNTNIANVGDAGGLRGSVAAGSLYFSLHTADPLDAGTQVTSEIAYTGYARVGKARAAGSTSMTVVNAVGSSLATASSIEVGVALANALVRSTFQRNSVTTEKIASSVTVGSLEFGTSTGIRTSSGTPTVASVNSATVNSRTTSARGTS